MVMKCIANSVRESETKGLNWFFFCTKQGVAVMCRQKFSKSHEVSGHENMGSASFWTHQVHIEMSLDPQTL